MLLLIMNGIIEAKFDDISEVSDDIKDQLIKVDRVPELDYSQPGKEPYYFWNGEQLEVRFNERALNTNEQLSILEQAVGELSVLIGGVLDV